MVDDMQVAGRDVRGHEPLDRGLAAREVAGAPGLQRSLTVGVRGPLAGVGRAARKGDAEIERLRFHKRVS